MYKIIFLPEAKNDLGLVRQYLSLYYKNTAKTFFGLLKKSIDTLKENPCMYQKFPERPLYRRLVIRDYLVFYKVNDIKNAIEIHRILHSSREIERYIP